MATEHKHPFAGISCCHVWSCHISQGTSCRWPLRLSIRHNPSLDTSEKREWSLQPRFNRRKPTLCCGRCICMSANVLKLQWCLIKNNNQHFCNILTIPQYRCMFSVATLPRLDPQMAWKMRWDICNSWVVVQKLTSQLVCKGWFTVYKVDTVICVVKMLDLKTSGFQGWRVSSFPVRFHYLRFSVVAVRNQKSQEMIQTKSKTNIYIYYIYICIYMVKKINHNHTYVWNCMDKLYKYVH